MSALNKRSLIILIICLIPVGQVAIDIYLPSLPIMVTELNTSSAMMQWSLTTFLMGFALSQLIGGPLSDFYGRLRILNIGLAIYLLGTLICALTHSAELLLVGRLIQGLGVGIAPLTGNAVLADLFSGRELAKYTSYNSIAYALPPIVAPVIGGYVQEFIGWRGNFYLLFFSTLILVIAANKILQDTRSNFQPTPIQARKQLQQFRHLLTNYRFIVYIICMSFAFALMICFNIIGPFFFQNTLGLSPIEFGQLALLAGLAYLCGAGLNGSLVRRVLPTKLLQIGICFALLFNSVLFIICILYPVNLWLIFIPICLSLASTGIIFPNAMALALAQYPQQAGAACAIIGFLILVGCSLVSFLIANLPVHSAFPMASVSIVLCFSMLLLVRVKRFVVST